jgi:sulfite exporter TauE/SafE/copper chaperone CopZ
MVTEKIIVKGMVCNGCEDVLESAIMQLDGVDDVKANYQTSSIKVKFDDDKITLIKIEQVCIAKGYLPQNLPATQHKIVKILFSFVALAILIALIILARNSGHLNHQFGLPTIDSSLSNMMIFVVGLVTGLHCVGMCGSFVVGYTLNDTQHGRSSYISHLLYGLGKTLAYAMFGALFGFLGSLFKITPFIGGVSAMIAGLFLVVFGLNMLNLFSILKRIRIKQPAAVVEFAIKNRKQSRSPFFIGFFSGFLLGCGPLQTMYVMAAGNGDALEGAKILTFFGLGTLPALLSFGVLARFLSSKMTRFFVHASAIILIVMGLMMINKGMMRTGFNFQFIQQKIAVVLHK